MSDSTSPPTRVSQSAPVADEAFARLVPGVVESNTVLDGLEWIDDWAPPAPAIEARRPTRSVPPELPARVTAEPAASERAAKAVEEIEAPTAEPEPAAESAVPSLTVPLSAVEIRSDGADASIEQALPASESVESEPADEPTEVLAEEETLLQAEDVEHVELPADADHEHIEFDDLEEAHAAELRAVGEPPSAPVAPPAPAKPADEVDQLMSEILATESKRAPAGPRRTSAADWFSEVFDETWLALSPKNLARQTLKQVTFIEQSLNLPRGSAILDIACGAGRHSVELAARGLEVSGIDKSLTMLERAVADAQRRSVGARFSFGDMRDLAFDAQFDAAICMDASFGYFDDETNREVVRRFSRALRPGGQLLLDVPNRDFIANYAPKRTWWESGDTLIMEDIGFDPMTSRLLVDRSIVDAEGDPWEQHISIRVYALHELAALFESAGLRITEVSGDFSHRGDYVGPQNRSLIVLAVRAE